MNFIFECITRYITSERSKWVKYRVEHANINDVFDDFPKISDNFPKVVENFPKLFRRLDERLRTFSKDCRRFRRQPKISKEELMMFRSYSNTCEFFLRDYVAIAMTNLRLVKLTWYFTYLLLTEFVGRTRSYETSFSPSIYKSNGKKTRIRNLQYGEKTRLVRYLLYLYCVSDGLRNDFYSHWTASNFWSTSKAKRANLKSFNTQFRVKESFKQF